MAMTPLGSSPRLCPRPVLKLCSGSPASLPLKSSCPCTPSILAEPQPRPLPPPALGSPARGLISPEAGWVNLVLTGLSRWAPQARLPLGSVGASQLRLAWGRKTVS